MRPDEFRRPPAPTGPLHLVLPRRPGADLARLRARLEEAPHLQEHDVVWHVPDKRGDIVALAQRAAQAARADGGLVVAAGGDGTINAVAAAALREGVPMGVVPLGTFNYFSRDQGLPLEPSAAVQELLEALRAGDLRPVQVGFVNNRAFLVNASVGLYPKLLAEREHASRRFGRSRWVALASAVWSMFRPASGRRWRVALRTQRGGAAQTLEQEHLVTMLFVGNSPLQLDRVGLPQAQSVAEGGQIAVVLLKPQGRWAVARTIWNAALGHLDRDSAVLSMACSELTVEPASWRPPQVKLAFDGEREWMQPPLHFRVGTRPVWLVAKSPLVRDGDGAAAREEGGLQPVRSAEEDGSNGGILPAPAGGLLPV